MVKYFNIYEDAEDVQLIDYGNQRSSGNHDDDISSPTTKPHDTSSFGGKSIGTFAGIALLVNTIAQTGTAQIPNLFAEAGWLAPTVLFILVWTMSSLSATMFCEAMRRIPGNEHFRGRIEYTSVVSYYFGRSGYLGAQICLNGALQSRNVAAVMASAKAMDKALAQIAGRSCGFDLSPYSYIDNNTAIAGGKQFWNCISSDQLSTAEPNPWGCHVIVSAGYLITLAMAIPVSIFNLEDNMKIQIVALVLMISCWATWISACFFESADPSYNIAFENWTLDAINTHVEYGSQTAVLGSVLFSFGFVTTIPSWVNEKRPNVSVNKTVWTATSLCLFFFFLIGLPAALNYKDYLEGPVTGTCKHAVEVDKHFNCAKDLTTVLLNKHLRPNTSHAGIVLVNITIYLFPIVALFSSIPVFSIVIKYNCLENGWSKKAAVLWGIVFPWTVAIPLLYMPDAMSQFIVFSSLVFVSFTDFVVPWCLYIVMTKQDRKTKVSSIHSDFDDNALLEIDPNLDGNLKTVKVHYAVPQSCSASRSCKIRTCLVLVTIMTLLSSTGIVLQIYSNIGDATTWDCADVM